MAWGSCSPSFWSGVRYSTPSISSERDLHLIVDVVAQEIDDQSQRQREKQADQRELLRKPQAVEQKNSRSEPTDVHGCAGAGKS